MDVLNTTSRLFGFRPPSCKSKVAKGCLRKLKTLKGPMSLRVFEKQSRERMNIRLQELNMLIPPTYRNMSKTRLEKIEIIEMAIKYINYLTSNQTGGSLNYIPKDQALHRNSPHTIENESSVMVKDGEMKHIPPYKKSTKSRKPFKLDDDEIPYHTSASFSASQSFEGHTKARKRSWTVPLKNCNFVPRSTTKASASDSSTKDRSPRSGKLMTDSQTSVPQSVSSSTSSGCQSSMDTGSDYSSGTVKFKHTITKRFFEESCFTGDSSSHNSRKSKKRRKLMRRKDREFRSGRSHFSSTHSTQKSNFSRAISQSDSIEESNSADRATSRYLPGFVLHPTGSYYIPMTISSSDIGYGFFKKATQQNQQCGYHSVTLFVQFKGPFIHMDNEKQSPNGHKTVQSLSSDGKTCSSCGCNARKPDTAES